MAVTNDGTNYFSGNIIGGVAITTIATDIGSMFTTLGVEHDFPATAYYNVAWTPNIGAETLTGTINNSDNNFSTTGTIHPNARFRHLLTGGAGGSTSGYARLNSSSTGTTTINGEALGITSSTLSTSLSGSQCWVVATDHSLATFVFKDVDNYLFVSTGVYDNSSGHTFPDDTFCLCSIKSTAVHKAAISSQNNFNQTTEVGIHEFGALTGNVPPNYDHTPTSGSTGDAWELYLRRSDNDFATGIVPNCIQVDQSVGGALAIGTIKNFDNITQGNDSIMGSTQDYFIKVGEYGVTDLTGGGDSIFMRISSL